MEIKNEEHATQMLQEWQNLSVAARQIRIKQAIEKLELGSMYYDQKGNDKGVNRCDNCILILKEHLAALKN